MKRSIVIVVLCFLLAFSAFATAVAEKATTAADRVLVLGMQGEPATLNSHSNAENIVLQMGHLYAGFLTSLHEENGGPIQPSVAKSWKFLTSTDIEFQLRDDVYFHNGRNLTADDIVFTFQWTLNPDNGSIRRSNFATSYGSIEKTGKYSFILHLKNPDPSLFELLAYLPIVAKDTVATLSTDNPIGCGPFKVESWNHGQQVNFVTFDQYWDRESIQYAKLVVRCFQDYNATVTALFADDIDIMLFLNTTDISAIQARGFKTQSVSDTGNYVACNVLNEKLSNPKVREAIKYSIDKQELIELLQGGVGDPVSQMYAPTSAFYNKSLDWETNLVRAKQALVDAGYPNGLDVEILTSNVSFRVNLSTILKEQLERAGFRVKVNVQENATMMSIWNSGGAELAIGAFGFYADPSFRTMFVSSTANNNWRRYGYNNDEYNNLYVKGMSSTDVAERFAIYSRMSEKYIDEAGFFMLLTSTSNCASKNNISGLVYRGSGNSDFTRIIFD